MASLSYYSTLEANYIQQLNSEMSLFPPYQLLDFNYANPDTLYLDPFLDFNEFDFPVAQPTNYTSSFVPDYSEFDETCPKRQKLIQHNYVNDVTPDSPMNGFVPPMIQDLSSFSFPQIPVAEPQPVYNAGADEVVKNGEKKQSIKARQRRKKLSEKTNELGKLIPGGHRMNTADRLHATLKYVRFLEAQLAILEIIPSYQQESEKPFETTQLQQLVGSPLIQEKLYSSGKCLVPKTFMEELGNNSSN